MQFTITAEQELASRAGDGVEVSLIWDPADGSVRVVVSDGRTGEQFELEVGDDNALDVFHHPYAYAAFRGVGHLMLERVDPRLQVLQRLDE